MQTLYRRKNRTNETVSLEEILAKGKNAHGAVVYVESESGGERQARYLDLPTRELVSLEEFKNRKRHRAEANYQKFQGRKPSSKRRRDCRSFSDEPRHDFLYHHGLGAT